MAQTEIPSYKRLHSPEKKNTQAKNKKTSMRLKKEDYISAAMVFLLSRASMIGAMSPFSMAFFAASYNKRRMPVTFLCMLIGCLSAKMGTGAIKYLIAGAVFIGYKMLFDKNNTASSALNATVSASSLFIGGMISIMSGVILFYDVLVLIFECLICAFLSVLFFDAAAIINNGIKIKKYLSNEQLLSCILVVGIALSGMKDITKIGPFNFSEIVCASVCIMVAYCRGMGMGACAGTCAGIVCAMSSEDMLPVIGIYALCSFLAGSAKPLGKFAVASVFIISSMSLGFMTTMYIYGNVGILNFLVGGILFCLIPTQTLEKIRDFTDGYYTSRSDEPYIQRMQEIMYTKLESVADSFDALALSFDELSKENDEQNLSKISGVIDDTAGKVCKLCGLCNHCWDKERASTHEALAVMAKKLEKKGYADVLDLPQDFRDKCVHLHEFVYTANHYFEIGRINSVWQSQLNESRRVLSQQYRGFAGVIDSLAEEFESGICIENKYEEKILSRLSKEHISLKSVCVFERGEESFEVEVEFFDKEDMKNSDIIAEAVSEILKQPMVMTHTLNDNLRVIYEPVLRYKMVSGVATIKKDGEEQNGDSYCMVSLPSNRYALAISDGMGSGKNAAGESGVVINLVRKLLLAGFDKMSVIKLINSALVIKNGTESFATVDLMITDLVSAQTDFIKVGASTGYIKRSDTIESIFCTTLPAGILSEADIQLSSRRLCEGDCVVLVSDGVANARKNSNWIYEVLESINVLEEPETIAEIILKEAIIHKKGIVDDDMTVIAAKILEK